MRKWEYCEVTIHMQDTKEFYTDLLLNGEVILSKVGTAETISYLNKLGEEGWEMVNTEWPRYLFKRPIE